MKGVTLRSTILPVALPLFLGMIVFQFQTVMNRIFLGQVDVTWLAVSSNVVFPMWTMMAMLNSLSTGATILVSQALGAGRTEEARRLTAVAVIGNSAVSLALFAFWASSSGFVYALMGVKGEILRQCVEYTRVASLSFILVGANGAMSAAFQASARTRPLMAAGMVRSAANLALDALLILGLWGAPKLGLMGAATATVAADVLGFLLLGAVFLRSRKLEARPAAADWKAARPAGYLRVVRMGLPTSMEDLLWNVGNLFLIGFLNALDPLAAAVYSIVFTIEILPIVAFSSLGQATVALVGRAKGAGDRGRIRPLALTAQAAAWAVSLAVAAAFLLFPGSFVALFTGDAALAARTAPILFVSSLMLFPRSVNFIAGSGIRGTGDTKWMLFTQALGTLFVVALGWLLIFGAGLGVIGLFLAMCADEAVRAILNGLRLRSLAPAAAGAALEREAA